MSTEGPSLGHLLPSTAENPLANEFRIALPISQIRPSLDPYFHFLHVAQRAIRDGAMLVSIKPAGRIFGNLGTGGLDSERRLA